MTDSHFRLQLTLTDDGAWRVTTGGHVGLVFDFSALTVLILDNDFEETPDLHRIDTIDVGVPADKPTAEPDLGPLLSADEMMERLGVGPETLRTFDYDHVALRIVLRAGYPAFQVVDGKLLPGLQSVLAELSDGIDDPQLHWRWLTTPAGWAGGQAPWKLLREGRTDDVIRAAGRAAWAWRDQNKGYS